MAEDLINIATYCSSMLVKYGSRLKACRAIYIPTDKKIEFYIIYDWTDHQHYSHFKYLINDCNFMMTGTEVLVNSDTIDIINKELDSRLLVKDVIYGKQE